MSALAKSGSALSERVVFGLLASAARLVPVPFLDDILRDTAMRLMVVRILRAHGRDYASGEVKGLYTDRSGCLTGCLLAGLKLLLFPIKKLITYVLAVRYLSQDLSVAILLGRVLDARLEAGELANEQDPKARLERSEHIRIAFDNAVKGTDLRVLRSILMRALRGVSGLPRAALAALRGLRGKGDAAAQDDPTAGMSAADREKVEAGAARVEAALADPEVQAFLRRFDAKLEENLSVLQTRAA